MKIISPISLILLSVFFFAGCATQKPMYSWGDYSSSLYKLKKNPCEETLMKHKQVLLKIVEDSKENSLRVPPGVYCEYGYILMKEGKSNEALSYFDLEEKTYPESAVFIQRLKSQFNKTKDQL
ncbi:MAG: DUF4810 domain-containing protein [Thermodesulfovibrionales bacterium]